MPRPYRGPTLWLDPSRGTWTILDGRRKQIRTGFTEQQRDQAIRAVQQYSNGNYSPNRPKPSRPANPNARKGVYVLGFGPYIKIGISLDIDDRISQLQTPEPVTVYAILDGWLIQERQLHLHFAAYRLQGEWFRREGDLADWISDNCPDIPGIFTQGQPAALFSIRSKPSSQTHAPDKTTYPY